MDMTLIHPKTEISTALNMSIRTVAINVGLMLS
jgi:hypothetical protein